ncbi:hypothetical protein A3Q56_01504 [Intoshia linei]|uniref:SH3 domain-containing protein n=1 Tax=Intoshia linei TaxID=1819745 RepID=A0A177BBD4_9BILA|nr:hypothetical protein A3Q56_01504 [Intoshia linei]
MNFDSLVKANDIDWCKLLDFCDRVNANYELIVDLSHVVMHVIHTGLDDEIERLLIILDSVVKNCSTAFSKMYTTCSFLDIMKNILIKRPDFINNIRTWSDDTLIDADFRSLVSIGIINILDKTINESKISTPTVPQNNNTNKIDAPKIVYAVLKFDAEEKDELNLEIGDVITVINDGDSNWWTGKKNDGSIGLFPSHFVSTTNVVQEPIIKEEKEQVVELNMDLINNVLSYIKSIDPSSLDPDNENFLIDEEKCKNMIPLVDQNIQTIDKKLFMLLNVQNNLNKSYKLYHDLLNNQMKKDRDTQRKIKESIPCINTNWPNAPQDPDVSNSQYPPFN